MTTALFSSLVGPTARAMHEAQKAMQGGQVQGKLTCPKCKGTINWAGRDGKSAGSCTSARCVRWAT
jgi:hypothetical protein